MPKLTIRTIDSFVKENPDSAKDRIFWDSQLSGFGIRFQPSGVKTFLVQYRNSEGRSRRLALGRYGALTPDQARDLAVQALSSVARGADPAAARKAKLIAPTMSQLLDRYLSDHVEVQNASTTAASVRRVVNTKIRPALGTLKAQSVTRQDVIKLHKSMAETPRQANNVLAIMSKVFSLAELWAVRPESSNPCRKVPRYPEAQRERFLSAEELSRLGDALEEAVSIGLPWSVNVAKPKAKHLAKPENRRTLINENAVAAIYLLLFSGARLTEILTLRWEHVDSDRGTIALPGRKGGERAPHPVSGVAMTLLAEITRVKDSPWVLPRSSDPKRHISKEVLESVWQRIRARAHISDVRLHDLRHTVGTFASQAGANAFVVRDVLRHKTLQMTGRYANFDADPVRQISDQVGQRIIKGLNLSMTKKSITIF